MPQLTRGPLEAGTYWRRRVFVLLSALTVVFVIAQVLGAGSNGDDPTPAAQPVAADTSPSSDATAQPTDDAATGTAGPRRGGAVPSYGPTYDPNLLADPEGTCSDDDLSVVPSVDDAVAAHPVTVTLALRTVTSEACTWKPAASKLTVKISSPAAADDGNPDGTVWTTQDCPATVPTDSVVVRRALATEIELSWNARTSTEGCPTLAAWANPGRYTIDAAALGGEPAQSTFDLVRTTADLTSDSTDGADGTDAPSGGSTGTGAPTGGASGGTGSGGTGSSGTGPGSGSPSGGATQPPSR